MTQVDQYEYEKSLMPQSLYKDQPFTEINYNFVNDINQGSYSNSSITLLQYDLTSIYSSSTMTDTRDHYLIIPTVRTAVLTNNTSAPVAPTPGCANLTSIKNGNLCILHQADLLLDGKTVHQLTPYTNILTNFNMVSQMSKDDLTLFGKIKGYGSTLDNPNSVIFADTSLNNPSTYYSGGAFYPSFPGLSNNNLFSDISLGTNLFPLASSNTQTIPGAPNAFTVNGCIQEKTSWTPYASSTGGDGQSSWNNIFGKGSVNGLDGQNLIMPTNNLNQDFTSYCTIINNTVVWYDYLYIKLADVLGSMENIALTRHFSGVLRLYINTGLITVSAINQVANGGVPTMQLQFRGQQYSTFTNTCPIMINNLGLSTNYSASPFTDITCGFFIARAPNYTINTYGDGAGAITAVNFGNVPSSSITATRYYYSTIVLDPVKAQDYLVSQQNKTVISKEFLFNTYTGIQAGANYSQLVQSGVKNIVAVVVIPLISQSVFGYSQFQSPFDSCGGTSFSPLSLINFQVAIGGVNQLRTTYTYSYQTWIQELCKYNKSSASELGVESGLVDYNFFNLNKIYMVNVRSERDDDQTPRNVVISFINNSNIACDILVYTIYEQEMIINCSTGAVVVK